MTTPWSAASPETAAVVAGHGRASILTADGELLTETSAAVAALLGDAPLLVHAPVTWRRLGLRPRPCLDLLELFAFVRPAHAAAPTPRGLALALDMDPPRDNEAAAAMLPEIVQVLLARLAAGRDTPANQGAAALAARMGVAGWGWASTIMAALGEPNAAPSSTGLSVWKRLPEWEEEAPPPPPGSHPVPPADARRRLAEMLGPHAEQRPGQGDYADCASAAFAPRQTRGDPQMVLAEAGTAPARRSATSPPRACGPSATAPPSGSAPIRGICSARWKPNSAACIRTRSAIAAGSWCARGGRTTCVS